jgi:hypothetical protein
MRHEQMTAARPDTIRRRAIREERCLVRVRDASTGARRTMAVCPGCWHTPDGRKRLLTAMHERGLEPVTRADGEDPSAGRLREEGIFNPTAQHAPRCPFFSTTSRKK